MLKSGWFIILVIFPECQASFHIFSLSMGNVLKIAPIILSTMGILSYITPFICFISLIIEEGLSALPTTFKDFIPILLNTSKAHRPHASLWYALVKSLEEIIDKKYEGILRKTFIREDDDYNQDVSPNSFLIEVGGNYNTINEVYNSLKVLSYAIYTFLEGNSWQKE